MKVVLEKNDKISDYNKIVIRRFKDYIKKSQSSKKQSIIDDNKSSIDDR